MKLVTVRLGVHKHIVKRRNHFELLLSSDEIEHKIGDISVVFPQKILSYRRFRDFHSEHEILEQILNDLNKEDVFWDVGAHLGWQTVFTSKKLLMVK